MRPPDRTLAPPPGGTVSSSAGANVLAEPQLVGCALELEALHDTVAHAHAGRAGVVLLEGAAGTGKSRLCQETRTYARRLGATVLAAPAASPLSSGAYATLRAALLHPAAQDAADRQALHDLSCALETAATHPDPAGLPGPLRAFRTLLSSAEAPLVVILDDAQHCDEESRRLVSVLVAQMESERLAVVLAGRPPADGRLGLDSLVAGASPQHLHRVQLEPLADVDACALARTAAGSAPSDATLRQLVDAAEGNPLLLVTMAEHLRQRGGVPLVLPDHIVRRLLPPGADLEELARGLAVTGRIHLAQLPALLAALSLERRAGEEAFDQLVRAGLAVAVDSGEFLLAPPILRESVYQGLGVAERHRLHRSLASCLAGLQAGGQSVDIRRIALHAAAGALGVDAAASALAAQAGDADLDSSATSAVTWYERAIELSPSSDPQRASLLARLTTALFRSGPAEATAHRGLEALAALPAGPERAGVVAAVSEALLARARPHQVLDLLATEQLSAPLDPRLMALRAAAALALGHHLDAAADLVVARSLLACESVDPETAVVVHTYTAYLACTKGDVGGTRESLSHVVSLAAAAPTYRQEWALGFGAFMLAAARMPVEAEPFLRRAQALNGARANAISWTSLAEVMMHACRGDWARLLADGGQLTESLLTDNDESGLAIVETLMYMAGWVRGSRHTLDSVIFQARPRTGHRPGIRGEALALYLLLRRGVPVDFPDDLSEGLRAAQPGWLAALVAPYFPLLWKDAGRPRDDEVLSCDGDFAHLVELLAAAEGDSDVEAALAAVVLAESLALPFYVAEAKLVAGELGAEPAEHLTGAWRIFDDIGADRYRQRTAALLRQHGLPVPRKRRLAPGTLTQSEWQVVELVSRGLRNRDIARQLSYSLRTVETYITRVYQKTGINSRIGLVQAIASGSLRCGEEGEC